jgi:hypothetical protein
LAGPTPDHPQRADPDACFDDTQPGVASGPRRTSGRRRDRATGTPDHTPAPVWSIDQIRALGVVTDLRTAARILGLSANTAYALAQRDQFPVPVLRAGGQYRVSVQAILAVLDTPPASPPPTLQDDGGQKSC